MSFCVKCGQEVADQAIKCNNCGQPVAAQPLNNMSAPPPATPYAQPGQIPATQKTNGFAIASLICGITGLFGLIFGIIALVQIGDERGPTRGRGLAIAGLVVSILIPIPIMAAILFPVFSKAREKARMTVCMSNQKQISLAINMYAQENAENLPTSASAWRTEIGLSGSKIMVCRNESGPISYGINNSLLGSKLGAFPNDTMYILLTADSQVDAIATVADVKKRHSGGAFASFLDGHVEYLPEGSEINLSPPGFNGDRRKAG